MPTYKHKCKNCGHEFEDFRSIRDSLRADYSCPVCKADRQVQEVVIGAVTAIFNGAGWSNDGYSKPDPSKSTPRL